MPPVATLPPQIIISLPVQTTLPEPMGGRPTPLELRDQARYDQKLQKLQAAIDEGEASGTFEGDPFAHVRAKHGLPDR